MVKKWIKYKGKILFEKVESQVFPRMPKYYEDDEACFMFLDGAHTWDVDGFAFVLMEKILEPGGLMIFDDLDWSIEGSPTLRNKNFPDRKKRDKGVRAVFEILVKSTPSLECWEDDGWAYARKRPE